MRTGQKAYAFACMIGLSLFLSWPYCVFSMSSLFVEDAHGGVLNNLCWVTSLTTLIISFSITYFLGNRLRTLLNNALFIGIITAIHATANVAMRVGGRNYRKLWRDYCSNRSCYYWRSHEFAASLLGAEARKFQFLCGSHYHSGGVCCRLC